MGHNVVSKLHPAKDVRNCYRIYSYANGLADYKYGFMDLNSEFKLLLTYYFFIKEDC